MPILNTIGQKLLKIISFADTSTYNLFPRHVSPCSPTKFLNKLFTHMFPLFYWHRHYIAQSGIFPIVPLCMLILRFK